MTPRITLALMSCLLLFAGCRSDKKFETHEVANKSGTVQTIKAEPKAEEPQTPPTIFPEPMANCDKESMGLTKAVLLSKGISTAFGNQTLRYELSMLSCKDGSAQAIKDQVVYFDLNSISPAGFRAYDYQTTDLMGNVLSSASFEVVTGSDLFGNVGNYAHWMTETFSVPGSLDKFILEIKLDNTQMKPINPGDLKIDSYLRIGKAQAVTESIPIID